MLRGTAYLGRQVRQLRPNWWTLGDQRTCPPTQDGVDTRFAHVVECVVQAASACFIRTLVEKGRLSLKAATPGVDVSVRAMRIPIFKVSLAATALVSIALTAGCGESTMEQKAKAFAAHVRVYGTTPSDASAALAKLRAPRGFSTVPCRSQEPGTNRRCFVKQPSIVLDNLVMEQLVAATGMTPWHGIGPAVACFPPKHFAVPRLSLQACHANVIMGAERLTLFTKSLVLAGPTTARGTTRSRRGVLAGTELMVEVVGHFLHEGIREGEQ